MAPTRLAVGQEIGPFQITKGPFSLKRILAARRIKPDPKVYLRREVYFTIACTECGQEKKHVSSGRLNGLINDAGYTHLRCHACYLKDPSAYLLLVASVHKPQKKTLR